MILTFLLHRMSAAPAIDSIYITALGSSPVLKGIIEHHVRHTLVSYHLVISRLSAPQHQVQTAPDPEFFFSGQSLLGLASVNIPALV